MSISRTKGLSDSWAICCMLSLLKSLLTIRKLNAWLKHKFHTDLCCENASYLEAICQFRRLCTDPDFVPHTFCCTNLNTAVFHTNTHTHTLTFLKSASSRSRFLPPRPQTWRIPESQSRRRGKWRCPWQYWEFLTCW